MKSQIPSRPRPDSFSNGDHLSRYLCPLRWETLDRLSAKLRWCDVCRREARLATTREKFRNLAAQGDCVAWCHPLPEGGEMVRFGQGLAKEYQNPSALVECPDHEL